ncbi:MAG: hypothetical protein D3925_00565 [Candidatus Electrothrix sp. AR5]|nr:hypothetical protein [Candidatus Electrothrix sp. AR5]
MSYYASIITALVGFVILIATYKRVREKGKISIIDYFMFFFLLQFGPHAWFPHYLKWHVDKVDINSLNMCNYGIALSYLCLSFSFVIGEKIIKINNTGYSDLPIKRFPRIIAITVVYIFAFIIASTRTNNSLFSMTYTYLAYLKGTSFFDYTEIRRLLYSDKNILTTMLNGTRYSLTPVLFSLIIGISFTFYRSKKIILSFLVFLFSLPLFVLLALQLNKLVYIYYFLLIILTVFHNKIDKVDLTHLKVDVNLIVGVVKTGLVLSALLFLLVFMQYRNLHDGFRMISYAASLIVYRIFISGGDELALWFDAYPDLFPFTGINNISKLATLLGTQVQDPTVDIPRLYLGDVLTTLQTGFIGSGYASFGYPGIVICSLIVGIVLMTLTKLTSRFNSPVLRASFVATMGLSTYFLTSSQLHTCLLSSGGLIVTPFFFVGLHFILRFRGR